MNEAYPYACRGGVSGRSGRGERAVDGGGHGAGAGRPWPQRDRGLATGELWDWSLGADATYKNLTFNVSYIDTDVSNHEAAYLRPSFSKGQDGTGNIAGGSVVVSLTAAF